MSVHTPPPGGSRGGRARRASVCLFVGLGCALSTLLAGCGEGASDEHDSVDPVTESDEPPFPIGGRVVSPSGDALPDATVQLVTWTPDEPPRVVGEVQTGRDGEFLFPRAEVSRAQHALVVEHAGTRRTVVPSLPPEAFREIRRAGARARAGVRDLRVRIAPTRPMSVRVRCTEAPREPSRVGDERPSGPGLAPRLVVFWGPGTDDVWWTGSVGAHASDRSDRLPGWELRRPAFAGSTREFELEVPLPAGEHTFLIDGGCGVEMRVVRVPDGAEAMPPLELALPHPAAGTLHVTLPERECASPPCDWGREHTTLERDSVLLGQYAVRPGSTTRVPRLPPGRYRLGPARCDRRVEIRAGETTEVAIDSDECEVLSVPSL